MADGATVVPVDWVRWTIFAIARAFACTVHSTKTSFNDLFATFVSALTRLLGFQEFLDFLILFGLVVLYFDARSGSCSVRVGYVRVSLQEFIGVLDLGCDLDARGDDA